MSDSISASFTGRVVADPETKSVGDKEAVQYRVAINGRKKVGGEWVDRPQFIRCVDFNPNRAKALTKGASVFVTGRLTWDEKPKDDGGGIFPPDLTVYEMNITAFANNDGKLTKGPNEVRKSKQDVPF